MLARHVIATAAVAAGLGLGVSTAAQAAPAPAHSGRVVASQSSNVVQPHVWRDMGYFNSLKDCQVAGAFYVYMGFGSSYYCAPMTDNQHQELSIWR